MISIRKTVLVPKYMTLNILSYLDKPGSVLQIISIVARVIKAIRK